MKNEYLEPLWEAFDTYAGYPAIVDEGGTRATSYAELKEKVCRVAAWLDAQGIEPASFIPIVMPQCEQVLRTRVGLGVVCPTASPRLIPAPCACAPTATTVSNTSDMRILFMALSPYMRMFVRYVPHRG